VAFQPCATYSGYIYCVGGQTSFNATTKVFSYANDVYYAPVSPSGVGTWANTTNYPASSIDEQSCAINSGDIYCVGGFEGPTTRYLTNAVYYAEVSSSGVRAWDSTASYPPATIFFESCAPASAYIVCVGGGAGDSSGAVGSTSAVYYDQVSAQTITLTSTTTSTTTATVVTTQMQTTTVTMSSSSILDLLGIASVTAAIFLLAVAVLVRRKRTPSAV